ncbi:MULTISPECIES: Rieske 2Fe-2S domain-containing protein [Lentzea]|uniref:Rieske-type oxygenase n=1 Tax=Lentzea flaviverrucosa TaxID=200379 RepID=A0A1H9CQS9_9PSEU|nr:MULTISPECIES: Rieske 2Fe-2S domain-containing protein [Lentzea]MCR3750154.1 3-ketosteroid 9alpha-monooxygenase subunit A [Lentzea californiensis]RDI24621.1 3-ketosteroid 9alpha-monooxygenase subunit A [Lentzea flaviverrucosa]SEQ03582.1 3-ketosteroid 9alpha-monooxygenase subunit A [Lentzea flaviverrucosa]
MTQDSVRTIDAGTPPARFARGWHCLGLASSFRDGKPHAIEAFGTKLVVFATEDGKINVLDGYCRHMGGDLTQGTIKGNNIACPFHDWRWAGNGKCVDIPYAKRVPLRARTRSWITLEENKQLFVWNDPQGNPPPEHITIPRIESAFSDEWSNWTWDSVVIDNANCREIIDNVVDMAHFFYIHFAFPTYFKNVMEGHVASQYLTTRGRPDVAMGSNYTGDVEVRSEAAYHGPSYMIDYLWNDYKGIEIETVLINCHYPISPTSFKLQWGAIVKKLPGVDDEHADKIARKFARGIGVGFLQDVEIWQNKSRIDNPLLCEEDGPVYQLRRWYEQFYVDVEDVSDDMVRRFEFEVDTSRAIEVWEKEVAENLARQESAT